MSEQQLSKTVVTESTVMALARELALDLYPRDMILEVLKLSPSQFQAIERTETFKKHFEEARLIWNSSENSPERVKMKASIQLEQWLEHLNHSMTAIGEPLSSKVKGGELLMRLAGLGNNVAADQGSSEKFTININMGSDKPTTIEAILPTRVIDATAEVVSGD